MHFKALNSIEKAIYKFPVSAIIHKQASAAANPPQKPPPPRKNPPRETVYSPSKHATSRTRPLRSYCLWYFYRSKCANTLKNANIIPSVFLKISSEQNPKRIRSYRQLQIRLCLEVMRPSSVPPQEASSARPKTLLGPLLRLSCHGHEPLMFCGSGGPGKESSLVIHTHVVFPSFTKSRTKSCVCVCRGLLGVHIIL